MDLSHPLFSAFGVCFRLSECGPLCLPYVLGLLARAIPCDLPLLHLCTDSRRQGSDDSQDDLLPRRRLRGGSDRAGSSNVEFQGLDDDYEEIL